MADTEADSGQFESQKEEEAKGKKQLVKLWLDAIALSDKEEEDWRKKAKEVIAIYRDEGEKERKQRRFNILYSNIETMGPAIYNSTPIPDVRVRFNDNNQPAKIAARVLEKSLAHCVDAYDFDQPMYACLKDMLLPGRGVSRVRYEPTIADEQVVHEAVMTEHVPWASFRRGPGRMWADVPWIAFELFLDKDSLERLAPKVAGKVNYDCDIRDDRQNDSDAPPPMIFKRARVWEIWDKDKREVLFIAPSYQDEPLRIEPDPMKLQGFFPIPRPLYAIETSDSLVPIEEYRLYRDQAEELDRVTRRITSLVAVMKWRGLYAADGETGGDMTRLTEADDGEFVPATDFMSTVVQGAGLDKAIWTMPLDVLSKVLEGLYLQREQIKQVIYEITGLSDILRGASKAQETATAQNIKQQWGSLRIQRKQSEIQRYVRDLFRIKAEIIAERFSVQTLQMMTGEQITPEVETILRKDVLRSYKIDIETDSTVRGDLTRAQENMTQFLAGTAQYISAVGPAIEAGFMPSQIAVEIYSSFARTFKLGKQAEDALDQLAQQAQQPQPPKPDPAAQKVQAELQVMQQKAQLDLQGKQADLEMAQQKNNMELQRMQAELDMKQQELALKAQELQMKQREMEMNAAMKQQSAAIDLDTKRQTADLNMATATFKANQARQSEVTA